MRDIGIKRFCTNGNTQRSPKITGRSPCVSSQSFYSLCFDLTCFAEKEKKLLIRHGHWMEALAQGKIKPYTSAQERFIKVDHGEEAAETEHEVAWIKLKNQRTAEKAKGLTLESDATKSFERPKPDVGFAADAIWHDAPPW